MWPWAGTNVYGTGTGANGTLRASFKAFNDAFAKNVVESERVGDHRPGAAPALPATVKSLDLATGAVSDVPVTWAPVDPADYANAGTFTVKGTAAVSVPARRPRAGDDGRDRDRRRRYVPHRRRRRHGPGDAVPDAGRAARRSARSAAGVEGVHRLDDGERDLDRGRRGADASATRAIWSTARSAWPSRCGWTSAGDLDGTGVQRRRADRVQAADQAPRTRCAPAATRRRSLSRSRPPRRNHCRPTTLA